MKENIFGIQVNVEDKMELIRKVIYAAEVNKGPVSLFCLNPHSLMLSFKDPDFYKALNDSEFVIPDGIGIVIASRLLGGTIRERLSGPDFFEAFSSYVNIKGNYSYFFLGSTQDVLDKIRIQMAQKNPNIEVKGLYAPPAYPWSLTENERILNTINSFAPDVLWVGMTAPKQEKWIFENKAKLNVKIIGAIGAAFDYFSEVKKRSPAIFRELGLEWLPRFLMEPGRLWRRNLISTPQFLFLIIREKLRRS
ncbi:MAG TPA: WecB/TagA/CpsF family glycosyltransferase [Candidatus Hydrothermia bacterium]|nr:WecB/TagA/CpsF family glycosyltransferase [Candidatus Atribacteria bacterium]MDD5573541.1 WecB/TagA/CpsF family glycosyltransferase [Candidatus Hydrothermia bacterium]HOK23738.1 WecB/TagA/CpsF family glycosyltransferase [Candidatus Hydrothermia bacterium]HOL24447.1 WecB/TagA/CpsF family glycosyltransferase [Candidatus Hydrothermia bacterium]HOP33333.1 WecB/TagA/CpsF family glycosyltransferase [Candidatus Hydrothermia bacterium]